MASVDPDLAKAGGGAEPPAGDVLRKDARHQFGKTKRFRGLGHGLDRQPANTLAARIPRHVDRDFGDARIGLPRPVLAGPGDAHEPTLPLNDHRWMGGGARRQLGRNHGGGSRLGLERGNPILDPLVVDGGDSRSVVRLGGPDGERGSDFSASSNPVQICDSSCDAMLGAAKEDRDAQLLFDSRQHRDGGNHLRLAARRHHGRRLALGAGQWLLESSAGCRLTGPLLGPIDILPHRGRKLDLDDGLRMRVDDALTPTIAIQL